MHAARSRCDGRDDPGALPLCCPDGFGAAFAAWRALGDAASYLPVRHGEPSPSRDEIDPERLYLLDLVSARTTMEHLASLDGSVRILDHHATAAEDLAGRPYVTIDLDRSGAHQDAAGHFDNR